MKKFILLLALLPSLSFAMTLEEREKMSTIFENTTAALFISCTVEKEYDLAKSQNRIAAGELTEKVCRCVLNKLVDYWDWYNEMIGSKLTKEQIVYLNFKTKVYSEELIKSYKAAIAIKLEMLRGHQGSY